MNRSKKAGSISLPATIGPFAGSENSPTLTIDAGSALSSIAPSPDYTRVAVCGTNGLCFIRSIVFLRSRIPWCKPAFKVIGCDEAGLALREVVNLRLGKSVSVKNSDVAWNHAPGLQMLMILNFLLVLLLRRTFNFDGRNVRS